jgi:hypothetical protein
MNDYDWRIYLKRKKKYHYYYYYILLYITITICDGDLILLG